MNNTLSIIKNALNETNDYKLHFNSVQLTKANLQEIEQALQEKSERDKLWHTELPLENGLYYGKKDDTNSMYPVRFDNGEWSLNAYPECKINIIKWAFWNSFVDVEQEHEKGCEYCNIEPNSYSKTILNQDSETGVYLSRDRKGNYELCCNSGAEFRSTKAKVCFNCGKDLRKGEDNG